MTRSGAAGRLARRLGLLGASAILALVALAPSVDAASGSIWTTLGDCNTPNPQNQNQYNVGDTVSVRGTNFSAATYSWDITQTGNGPTVASGTFDVLGTGDFCVASHVIQPSEAGHEYQVTFDTKHDNYSVNEAAPTPTPTPTPGATPTPTPEPSSGAAATETASMPPTDVAARGHVGPESLGLAVMALAALVGTLMVLRPGRERRS